MIAGGAGGTGREAGRIRVLPDPEKDLACARLPLTHLGNAERWRIRHGADFRFCDVLGWFAWDGRRWELLSEEKDAVPQAVVWSIACTIRAIRNEAALVCASGYPPPDGLSDKELARFEAWADAGSRADRDSYLRGDEEGTRAKWLEELEPMDFLLDKGKQVMWSAKIAAWAKTSESGGSPKQLMHWIKGFPDIVIRPDALDRDRMAINVLNGTLRLVPNRRKRTEEEKREWLERRGFGPDGGAASATARPQAPRSEAEGAAPGNGGPDGPPQPPEWKTDGWRVKLHPHAREDLLTKLAPVKYSASATCPAYDAFIARVQPEETMRRFIHQWGGLSLTGDIGEHKLAFFHGGGRNGKGTWVEAVAHIVGDYAGSIGIESLAESGGRRRGDQATPDIARLPGVRFLRVSEPEKGMRWNDGLIKQLTGGDPVDARHLNKGFFTFLPSFKLTVSGNNKPRVNDLSHGMWSRMQLVPWGVTIPDEEIDRSLGDKLKAEAAGILNRLIDGLLDWRTHGLIVPDEVRMATRAYRDDSDDLGRFLSELCEVSDDHKNVRVGSQELLHLYQAWADVAGGSPRNPKTFKQAMEEKGFAQIPSNGMKWLGVQPRPGVVLEDVKRGVWPGIDAPESRANPPPEDDGWVPPEWGGEPDG